MPARVRPAFAALWGLDLAFADIVATSSDPRVGAIRMAWWREHLDALTPASAPAEPRLQALANYLLPLGIGGQLSALEDGWSVLLNPFPWGMAQADGLRQRGKLLFSVGSQILSAESRAAELGGAMWSLADGAFHCSDPESRQFLLAEARGAAAKAPAKIEKQLRPMTVIAALAAADLLGKSGGGRTMAALGHRLFGTFPRS